MMPHDVMVKTFKAALCLKGMSQYHWADEMGITEGHLTHVLSGRRDSKKLKKAIHIFVRDTFNEVIRTPGFNVPVKR